MRQLDRRCDQLSLGSERCRDVRTQPVPNDKHLINRNFSVEVKTKYADCATPANPKNKEGNVFDGITDERPKQLLVCPCGMWRNSKLALAIPFQSSSKRPTGTDLLDPNESFRISVEAV